MGTILRNRLRQLLAGPLGLPDIPVGLARLSTLGFHPRVIFDVGAYQGDFAKLAHGIWPQAELVCFEALPHKVRALEQLKAGGLPMKIIPGLVGASSATNVAFHEMETGSSVLEEQVTQESVVSYQNMRTIDEIVETDLSGGHPDLIKIDVQGYELEVLKGAQGTLTHTGAILAEMNFLDIHQGVPLADEILHWLRTRGWVAYDICSLTRRPLDRALWQADFVFVPIDSELRRNKRWS
jgi:FkbM family methyltransferase